MMEQSLDPSTTQIQEYITANLQGAHFFMPFPRQPTHPSSQCHHPL